MEFDCDDIDIHDNNEEPVEEPASTSDDFTDNGENYELPEEEEVPDD